MTRTSLPFDRNAGRWGRYAESLKGRMRRALVLGQLEAHLPGADIPLRVLDAGCGAGDMAAALLGRSTQMILLDFSTGMLEQAGRRLAARFPPETLTRVALIHGRVEQIDTCLMNRAFDLILCHNVLEYADDPRAVLHALTAHLAPEGHLSLLAANRYGDVFKQALAKFDFEAARASLENDTSKADLFDRAAKRTFLLSELQTMIQELDLNLSAAYGVRLFTDYLPTQIADTPENEPLLLRLERTAAGIDACLQVSNSFHLICRKPLAEPASAFAR
jgi:SAM-dependent methyltransferase